MISPTQAPVPLVVSLHLCLPPVALDPPRLPSGGLIFPCYAFLVDPLDLSSVDHSPGSLNQGVEYHPCSRGHVSIGEALSYNGSSSISLKRHKRKKSRSVRSSGHSEDGHLC